MWIVPDNLYSPIRQDAVLLKKGAANAAARAFLEFLRSADAGAVIARYGYTHSP
jgi:molybdate transport system substrate-binding protein